MRHPWQGSSSDRGTICSIVSERLTTIAFNVNCLVVVSDLDCVDITFQRPLLFQIVVLRLDSRRIQVTHCGYLAAEDYQVRLRIHVAELLLQISDLVHKVLLLLFKLSVLL